VGYANDMAENKLAIFLDAVAPGFAYFDDTLKYGPEIFLAPEDLVSRHYQIGYYY
jgi:hypothetical protein